MCFSFYCSDCHGYFCHFVCGTEKGTGFLWRIRRACLAGLFYFVQAVGECGFGQSGGNLCFDNFKSYSGSSKMQSCHDLSGIRDFPLVPGAGIYYTAYYLISGMPAKCSAKGLETFEIALAIVFGIIFGFSIPETLFHKRKQ